MLDIGGPELLVIAVITLIVVGPKDLPKVVRTVGQVVGKVRGMANEFKLSLQELEDETEFRQMKDDLNRMARQEMDSARQYVSTHIPEIDDDPEAGFDDDWALPETGGDRKTDAPHPGTDKPARADDPQTIDAAETPADPPEPADGPAVPPPRKVED